MTYPSNLLPRHYPATTDPILAFGEDTLAKLTAYIFSWRQGPGSFGNLHLHSCWQDSSALARGYQGTSTPVSCNMLHGVLALAKGIDGERWRHLADCIASQLLWQQAPEGGFFHASGEAEPTYTSTESCPIHQMNPVLALLAYYETKLQGDPIRTEIERVLTKHLAWFAQHWWKLGNGWKRPLPFPGWCGVTNQDLVAVAALARYGQVIGDTKPLLDFGVPVLETYLGPTYYHVSTGLFERGDQANFTERCSYLCLITQMLAAIQVIHPDSRIPKVTERIADILAEATYIDENGKYHIAWGANDKAGDGENKWDTRRQQISEYPDFVSTLRTFGQTDTTSFQKKIAGLEATLAGYVFEDGTIPSALDHTAPLFAISPSIWVFWKFLIERHPRGTPFIDEPQLPVIRRVCGEWEFASSTERWILRQSGKVVFSGVKRFPYGILRSEQNPVNYPCPEMGDPEILEDVAVTA